MTLLMNARRDLHPLPLPQEDQLVSTVDTHGDDYRLADAEAG